MIFLPEMTQRTKILAQLSLVFYGLTIAEKLIFSEVKLHNGIKRPSIKFPDQA